MGGTLGDLLKTSSDPAIIFSAIELVRLRQIESLSEPLTQIAHNETHTSDLRIEAIGALKPTGQAE
ncbi:MAG: hypothetical protein R3B93_02120 [Bacteroidia bacterium]